PLGRACGVGCRGAGQVEDDAGGFGDLTHAFEGVGSAGSFEDLEVSAEIMPWKRPDSGLWLTGRQDD
ncbi:hypothetical protein ACFU7Y_44155, partial [Kitasatospora sp. NPDC057542]|uniref:hypothetical protein n=1 Tax=Kitasatospora sp. NPDC057542 TaxID=3346162 RepID=UPI0036AA1B18